MGFIASRGGWTPDYQYHSHTGECKPTVIEAIKSCDDAAKDEDMGGTPCSGMSYQIDTCIEQNVQANAEATASGNVTWIAYAFFEEAPDHPQYPGMFRGLDRSSSYAHLAADKAMKAVAQNPNRKLICIHLKKYVQPSQR